MLIEFLEILREMEENFQTNNYSNAMIQLNKMTNEQLALLVYGANLLNSSLYQHLSSLDIFWEQKFKNLRVKSLAEFKFQCIPNKSSMELFCGYVLFLNSLISENPNFNDLAIRGFNSFHALKNLSCDLIEKFDKNLLKIAENTVTSVDEALGESLIQPILAFYNAFKDQLSTHKTPGSLCLANITVLMARVYDLCNLPAQAKFYLEETWYHLHRASLLEKHSLAEIHNAYFGKGIAFSNHLNTSSISELKRACYHLSLEIDEPLKFAQLTSIENNASKDVLKEFPEILEKVEAKAAETSDAASSSRRRELKKSPSLMMNAFTLLSPVFKNRRLNRDGPKASDIQEECSYEP